MLKRLFLLILLFSLQRSAKAQYYFRGSEYGIAAGGSQYFGDLNEDYGFKFVRPAFGAFVRLHLNPYISIKGAVNYTRVGYADKYSSNPYNQKRNLSFQSNVFEAVVQAEFNFFRFTTGEVGNRWTPYLTGGVGAFYYNPFTELDGKKYYLKPLGTEGQNSIAGNRAYHKVAMCFPVGVGFKYWLRPGMNIGFEVADRLTLTDYLDDVSTTYVGSNYFPNDPQTQNPAYYLQDRSIEIDPSDPLGRPGKQRGNSSTKDQYLMFMVNLSFQLRVYKCPAYMNRGIMDF